MILRHKSSEWLETTMLLNFEQVIKRVFYLLIFVIQENEIVISVIRDPLFFLFVNRARDPPVRPSSFDVTASSPKLRL